VVTSIAHLAVAIYVRAPLKFTQLDRERERKKEREKNRRRCEGEDAAFFANSFGHCLLAPSSVGWAQAFC